MIPEAGCQMRSHSKYSNALKRSDPVLRAMLAPNWREPLPTDGASEMDMVAETTVSRSETTPTAVVG
jgi:hypothetical protein